MRRSEVGDERGEDDGVDALGDRDHRCDGAEECRRPNSEWISVAGKTPRSAIENNPLATANTELGASAWRDADGSWANATKKG